jgi:hypothetical protein
LAVVGPRLVREGASAPLRLHLEDGWGNVVSDEEARFEGSIAGKFPSSGWAATTVDLPPLPPGSHEIAVAATLADGRELRSSTLVDVVADLPGERVWFADLHAHSDDTVGTQDTPYNLAYAREVGGLDVLGYTANDFQITAAAWDDVVRRCRAAEEEGAFVVYPGVEWCGNASVGGDHNVVFLGEDTTLARSLEWHDSMSAAVPEPQNWPITELYDAYAARPDDYLLIPHLGGRRAMLDWHHPELERLIEVHSSWGTGGWFLRDALARGLRLGASASSDEHRGRPGAGAPGANVFGARGGLTGVLAPELGHAAVGTALRARRTWATTGARAVALLRGGEAWMGDELEVDGEPIVASYALYGDAPWEELTVFDTEGVLLRRRLVDEVGLGTSGSAAPSDGAGSTTGATGDLVRVSWGGARHRDRYRWASWSGTVDVGGAELLGAEPWAFLHPEQELSVDGSRLRWSARTFGGDVGAVLRLGPGDAELAIEAWVAEDDRVERFTVRREDLDAGPVRRDLGGAGLHVTVERVAAPADLPLTLAGELTLDPPPGDSAVYLHARQADGHEVWTSPLFFHR